VESMASMARAVTTAPTGVVKVAGIMNMVNTATVVDVACGAKAVLPVRHDTRCRRRCGR
jgi:hypothetical protein